MLAELLTPAKTLVNELTLRANASTVTRTQLENLIGLEHMIWKDVQLLNLLIKQMSEPT